MAINFEDMTQYDGSIHLVYRTAVRSPSRVSLGIVHGGEIDLQEGGFGWSTPYGDVRSKQGAYLTGGRVDCLPPPAC